MNTPITVNCPTCNASVTWSAISKYRPFCSERCKLIDLGEWASENRRIPGEKRPHGFPADTDKDSNY